MGDISSGQLDLLLTEAEFLADKHNSLLDQLTIMQLKSEISIALRKFHIAILKIRKGLKLLKENNLIVNNIDFYIDFATHIIKAYCFKLDFESAKKQIAEIKIVITQLPSKLGYEGYLRSLLIYHKHKSNLVESFLDLKNYMKFLEYNDYNLSYLDPNLISIHIFYYLIQGLELSENLYDNEISKYIDILNKISQNIPETENYIALIKINQIYQKIDSKIVNEMQYSDIVNSFEELKLKCDISSELSIIIKCHYLNFLANQIGTNNDIKNLLQSLSKTFSETLISSPYVIIYTKFGIIDRILQDEIDSAMEFILRLNEFFNINELNKIKKILVDYNSGSLSLKCVLIALLSDEISFGKFEIHKEKPISVTKKNS